MFVCVEVCEFLRLCVQCWSARQRAKCHFRFRVVNKYTHVYLYIFLLQILCGVKSCTYFYTKTNFQHFNSICSCLTHMRQRKQLCHSGRILKNRLMMTCGMHGMLHASRINMHPICIYM